MKLKNLKNREFYRLVVHSRGPNTKAGKARWWCLCECGEGCLVAGSDLLTGNTKSCGCWNREQCSAVGSRKRTGTEQLGAKNPAWKGGISTENNRVRSSQGYATWRTQVFEQDDYTCQKCQKRGGKLNAHHVESFHNNPEFRTAVGNGITFCENCHKDFHHQYGNTCSVKQVRLFILG